jgi:hypothetical protein
VRPHPRFRVAALFPWMLLFTGLLLVVAMLGALPRSACAQSSRSFLVAPSFGVRSFESKLDLENEAAIGARLGLGVNDRVTVLTDVVHSVPARKTTGRLAYVTGLRTLVQVRLLTGSLRPFAIAGVGGILFNFSDAIDTASGAVTLGGGVELMVRNRLGIYAEGSADFYRARQVTYSSTGEELTTSDRSTDSATTVAVGISVGF